MFGDDPDPTATTARVGSGEVPDARVRDSKHYAERVSGSGGCQQTVQKLWAERREERGLVTVTGDRKRPTLDQLYCRYS